MALMIDSGVATSTQGADSFITNDFVLTGAIHWVDSQTGNNANPGSESSPLATLAQAITNATANNGDIIVIKSGHSEVLTSTVTILKAGLKIFGIGVGSSAPKFTVNAAIDGIQISGASVELNNLYFPAGTTAINSSKVRVDTAGVVVRGCRFEQGTFDATAIRLMVGATYSRIEDVSISVVADGPDYGIRFEGAAGGFTIVDSSFDGGDFNFDYAAVYSAVAHLNFKYDNLTLTGDAGIQHTNTASKGWLGKITAGEGSTVQV